jgi:hypothetical protein
MKVFQPAMTPERDFAGLKCHAIADFHRENDPQSSSAKHAALDVTTRCPPPQDHMLKPMRKMGLAKRSPHGQLFDRTLNQRRHHTRLKRNPRRAIAAIQRNRARTWV